MPQKKSDRSRSYNFYFFIFTLLLFCGQENRANRVTIVAAAAAIRKEAARIEERATHAVREALEERRRPLVAIAALVVEAAATASGWEENPITISSSHFVAIYTI